MISIKMDLFTFGLPVLGMIQSWAGIKIRINDIFSKIFAYTHKLVW